MSIKTCVPVRIINVTAMCRRSRVHVLPVLLEDNINLGMLRYHEIRLSYVPISHCFAY